MGHRLWFDPQYGCEVRYATHSQSADTVQIFLTPAPLTTHLHHPPSPHTFTTHLHHTPSPPTFATHFRHPPSSPSPPSPHTHLRDLNRPPSLSLPPSPPSSERTSKPALPTSTVRCISAHPSHSPARPPPLPHTSSTDIAFPLRLAY